MEIKISEDEEIIREGLANIIVPKLTKYKRINGVVEPAWMPVFYNPDAVISRDLTTLFLKSVYNNRGFFFIDLLGGTGVRGVRITLETGGHGIINDIDARAYYYIRKNIYINNLDDKVEAFNHEANSLLNNMVLSSITVDYIDIDPYGSPIPYIDSAFKPLSKNSFLGITATDTAPLMCSHSHKALRRYWFRCLHVDFEKELGVRILLANIAMRGAALDIEVRPVLSLVYRHFIRVFLETRRSSRGSYENLNKCLGYLWFCPNTLERGFSRSVEEAGHNTCLDGSKPMIGDRIWICNINEEEKIKNMIDLSRDMNWISARTIKILNMIKEESCINDPYIRVDKLCSLLGINMPKLSDLVKTLREIGIRAARTHMDPRAIRIKDNFKVLYDVLRGMKKDK
ncbi:MAG: tRNA (guanine(26)-N(2))-dimethyltransferase [Desulfurococcaceae archaeon]